MNDIEYTRRRDNLKELSAILNLTPITTISDARKKLGIKPKYIGNKISILDLIGSSIVILDYDICITHPTESTEKPTVRMFIVYNEEVRICFTSSKQILDELEEVKSQLPLSCTVLKFNNSYTLR